MTKRFIIALILLVIVCGGIVGYNLFRDKMIAQYFANMQPPAATVSTVVVKPIGWSPGIEAIGTVSAVRGVDLNVETSGIVKEILFNANQKVEAGDVLVQLDDADPESRPRCRQGTGGAGQDLARTGRGVAEAARRIGRQRGFRPRGRRSFAVEGRQACRPRSTRNS